MTRIKHYVFDIGRVLIHYDPEIPYRALIPDTDRRRWFLETVCSPGWNLEQDRGRSWVDGERELIGKYPEEAELIMAFRKNWHAMVSHAYEDTVALMETLVGRGEDVTMLTNFSDDTYPEACERFPFLSRPRGVTVSGEVKLIKPDRAIYEHHTEKFGLDPAATLFIDDSAVNIAGARDYGWQAVVFTNAEALKSDLERFGAGL